jgi:hypothetical protein
MKKVSFLVLFIAFINVLNSQTSEYFSLVSYIQDHLQQNTQNRLIAVSVWTPSDKNSRDVNSQLNEACYVFQNAKLKGGNKGIIGLIICNDADEVSANIILKKDNISNLIVVNASQLSSFPELSKKPSSYNAVYNMNGEKVYENLQSNTVFDSIRNLITR